MDDDATKFCRTCDYSLQGLSELRCPECGRAFEPSDPRSYAARPWRVRRWRLGVKVGVVVSFMSILFLFNFGVSWSDARYSCASCAARRQVKEAAFLGIPIRHDVALDEGAISKFVQAYEDSTCLHVWEGASGEFRELNGGARWQGRGRERHGWSRMIDSNSSIYAPQYLERKAASDDEFAPRLIILIRADYFNRSDPLCQEIFNELVDMADDVLQGSPPVDNDSTIGAKSE